MSPYNLQEAERPGRSRFLSRKPLPMRKLCAMLHSGDELRNTSL
jgi:hypothetical protein